MKEFIVYISQFGNFNQQQVDFISKKAKTLQLKKGECFWEAGKIPQQIGFLLEGVIRVYNCDENGKELTRYFIGENNLIADWEGYKTIFYLQALTDCKLVMFSRKDWKEICATINGWDNTIQKIISKHHLEKLERRSSLITQDATTRYTEFLHTFSSLVNRVPLAYVASYLGINQGSLSRIRKNIH